LSESALQLSAIPFRDQQRAAANLEAVGKRVPEVVTRLVTSLLADSPDPDSALNLFERLCAEVDRGVLRLLETHPFLIHYALTIFGASKYLGETLIQNPDLIHSLAREKNLDRSESQEDYSERFARLRARSSEADFSALLARFKKREYIRIMLRDVLRIASMAEITMEISALSDVLIEKAWIECDSALRKRYGAPQHLGVEQRVLETDFAVLSLGKLGGNELNYSSDIDLLFLFEDGENPSSDGLHNREYFARLAQQITETLSRVTKEGAVFRIDLRLRPQGNEGEAAIALTQALRYYQEAAHDWELQALIKVRHSAGDVELSRQFIRGVQPRVYRTGLNFSAMETALTSREKIGSRRRFHRAVSKIEQGIDVKVDRGGIRDIEFLVQCLQRVYGGEEPWLRSSGTLFALQKLHDKNHISGKDFHELNDTYEFLRRIEHRLQLKHGQQTHRLPEPAEEVMILARSVTPAHERQTADFGDQMVDNLQCKMNRVGQIYQRIIHEQQVMQQQEEAGKQFRLRPMPNAEPGREQSFEQVLHRLAVDSVPLYKMASRRDLSSRMRRMLHRFLSSALTSSERWASVMESGEALERALSIFENSDFLSDILIRHPEEIAILEDPALQFHATQQEWLNLKGEEAQTAPDATLEFLPEADYSYAEKMVLLRKHYRQRVFILGVTDILNARCVFDSLLETSNAADAAIRAALAIAEGRHELKCSGLAVLALGRLGTYEFDIASDADLIFVRADDLDAEVATRIAEQTVDILTAYTQEGTVFPVDTRLRPLGSDGDLVCTVSALDSYFSEKGEARAWEGLSFSKVRAIAGPEDLAASAVGAIVREIKHFSSLPNFLPQVLEMRTRLAEAESARGKNFKRGPGGFYDIDFLAGYLQIKHGMAHACANIRDRLYALASHRLIGDADCATLDYAAEFLRTVDHVIRLVKGRARPAPPGSEHGMEVVEKLVGRILQKDFPAGIEHELDRVTTEVRATFNRLMA
jgi:glutamate-ammonia-ligase adenylyltransferase